jgi:hypothetical protein
MFVHIYMSDMNKLYLSPFTRTDIIIVLVGLLLLMIFLHIPTQPCSGCYLFIFWHRLIISAMKVCYYQTVGEVASPPSCGHWSQCQIDFWGHIHVRDITFSLSFDIHLCYLVWSCATIRQWAMYHHDLHVAIDLNVKLISGCIFISGM